MPRMDLVRRRRSATPDQPTFLTGLAGAIGWAPGSRAIQTALGGDRELNVVVGVCCVARFLKRSGRPLHALQASLPSSKPVRPHSEPRAVQCRDGVGHNITARDGWSSASLRAFGTRSYIGLRFSNC